MKKIKLVISLMSLVAASMTWAANPSPLGLWKTIDDETGQPKAIVQISQTEHSKLIGKIIKIFPRPGHDQNEVCKACDGEKHNQRIVGMVFLENLVASKDTSNMWTDGSILDPKNGKTYHCNVQLGKNGETLNVRGYLGLPLFGRTQVWKRVDNLSEMA